MSAEAAKTEAAAAPVVEKQTNCPACNKPLKKIRSYYRNNKLYCTKKCWKKATQPKEEDKK
ncbi:MAG: hypothetical protein FJZ15_04660 [Candidatus Omnitrophica bacterium]|nr:hypothetical protein [Candidatus Omnitrophota bacterium]